MNTTLPQTKTIASVSTITTSRKSKLIAVWKMVDGRLLCEWKPDCN